MYITIKAEPIKYNIGYNYLVKSVDEHGNDHQFWCKTLEEARDIFRTRSIWDGVVHLISNKTGKTLASKDTEGNEVGYNGRKWD